MSGGARPDPEAGEPDGGTSPPFWIRPIIRIESLRGQLLSGLTVLLLMALLAIASALLLWLPDAPSPRILLLGIALLILADVAVVVLFGDYLLRKQFLEPVESMVAEAEAIAGGDRERRLEVDGSRELRRLAASINRMADRLIRNQELLAENVRSLNETNRALTEAQDELVQAEKLASVGRLAAGIAHEVGNPLGAILGYLDVARRRGSADTEWLSEVRREAERIDRLVRGLLDYARPRPAAARNTPVNEAVDAALDLLETQGRLKGVRVRRDLEEPSPRVRGDPHQLEQVLVNLLLNARDAMEAAAGEGPEPTSGPAGAEAEGSIVVRTREERYGGVVPPGGGSPVRRRDDPEGVDYSHLRRFRRRPSALPVPGFENGDPVVRVEVQDTGVGLPEEAEEIFDPFYTTKEPGRGTGLGLAVCVRLVAGMSGTISAEPVPEGGARFVILLPAVEGGEPEAKDEEEGESR